MELRRLALAASTALLLSGCASSGTQTEASLAAVQGGEENVAPPGATQEVVSTPVSRDTVKCWKERPTGSRLARRVCMTQEERNEMATQARQWLSTGGASGTVGVAYSTVDPGD